MNGAEDDWIAARMSGSIPVPTSRPTDEELLREAWTLITNVEAPSSSWRSMASKWYKAVEGRLLVQEQQPPAIPSTPNAEQRDFERALEDYGVLVAEYQEDPAAKEVPLARAKKRVLDLYATKEKPDAR